MNTNNCQRWQLLLLYLLLGSLISCHARFNGIVIDTEPVPTTPGTDTSGPGTDNSTPSPTTTSGEILSIKRKIGQVNPTYATSITFTVIFSEDVQNVSTDDFELSTIAGTTTGEISSITPISAAEYEVTVSNVNNDGEIRLNFKDIDQDVKNIAHTGDLVSYTADGDETFTLQDTGSFISEWTTSVAGTSGVNEILLPLSNRGGTNNFTVDWGDGSQSTITSWSDVDKTHTYAVPGTYTIKMTGLFHGFAFEGADDKDKIQNIVRWGPQLWGSPDKAFHGCTNLTMTATDAPNLGTHTNYAFMFLGAEQINGDFSRWDVSHATEMTNMFMNATNFNSDISNWDVSNVSIFRAMFYNATSFNQDIGGWQTTSATTMKNMFLGATSFNQDISEWDMNGVLDAGGMFSGTVAFNQDLTNWDTSTIQDMSEMFSGSSFNGNISTWNLASLTNMSQMFRSNYIFNQNISAWNTSTVSNMSEAFLDAVLFNQDLSGWTVNPNVTSCSMFDLSTPQWAGANKPDFQNCTP